MKKFLLLLIALCIEYNVFAQTINNMVFGQNANLTAKVGVNTNAGGLLDNYWQTSGTLAGQNYIQQAYVKWMRYGGIQVEKQCLIDESILPGNTQKNIDITIQDYIEKAIAFQDNGMQAMMTLPLNPSFGNNFSASAAQVAKLVKGVNDGLVGLGKNPVLYWVYSNEPEGDPHYYNGTDAAQKIHAYIKAYYEAIMVTNGGVWNSNWGTPKFVGPELYSYDNTSVQNDLMSKIEFPFDAVSASKN